MEFIIEEKLYEYDEMKKILSFENEELEYYLGKIKMAGLLTELDSTKDKQILIVDEGIEDGKLRSHKTFYKFKYVGVLQLGTKVTLLMYPKYYSEIVKDDINYSDFKEVIQVIEKYKKSKPLDLYDIEDNEEKFSDELTLQFNIVKDYIEYGLYNAELETTTLNSGEEILWDKTINELNPYFIDGMPHYLDYYTKNNHSDELNIIRSIQMICITNISNNIETLLDIVNLPSVKLTDEDLSEIGEIDYIDYILEKELTSQFVSSNRRIIKNLRRYINKKVNSSEDTSVSLYGHKYFNLIWEDVCRVYYDDIQDKTFEELKLTPPDGIEKETKLNLSIGKPLWIMNGPTENGEILSENKKGYEFDILHLDNKCLRIIDAKYYNLLIAGNKVRNKPGLGDITKQFMYQIVLEDIIRMNKLTIKNTFIFPVNNEDMVDEVGKIKFDEIQKFGGKDRGIVDINIVMKDPRQLYKYYLASSF